MASLSARIVNQIKGISSVLPRNSKAICFFQPKSSLRRPFSGFRPFSTDVQPEERDEHFESIVKEISSGDAEVENRMRVISLEIEMMRQSTGSVPDAAFISKRYWENMLELPSRSQRIKYLKYLYKTSKSIENRKKKTEIRKQERLDELESIKGKEPALEPYSLITNSMFIRIYEKTINKFYHSKLMEAMLHGQKLVIDCSYDNYMNRREAENSAKQLTHLFSENRTHVDPFDLHFCNVDKDSIAIKQLYRYIPTIEDPDFPFNLHTQSHLELFPKEKLVYLSPHCRNDLIFDPEDIYIIGSMVDKVNNEPLSLAKAKESGLRMARLPLDDHLLWKGGSGKSLTLNQVCHIMLDYKLTKDWNHALRHVPRRKVSESDTQINEAIDQHLYRMRSVTSETGNTEPKENKQNFRHQRKPTFQKKGFSKKFVTSLFEE